MKQLKKQSFFFFTFFIIIVFSCQSKVNAFNWYEYFKNDYNNNKEFEYTNIVQWHNKGYTGKGVNIAIIDEPADSSLDIFDKKLKDPFNLINNSNKDKFLNSHGQQVIEVAHMVAQGATIYILDSSKSLKDNLTWCANNNINIVNLSRTMYSLNKKESETISKIAYDKNILLVKSVGNNGETDGTKDELAKGDIWLSVGSAELSAGNKPIRSDYSSFGEGLNVMGFGKLYCTGIHDKSYPSNEKYFISSTTGTSISSPFVAGMSALYYQFYKEQFGRFPTTEKAKEFIFDNCEKMCNKYWDSYTGYGVFVLPNVSFLEKGYSFVNKIIFTDRKQSDTDWLERGMYGNLKFDKDKDDEEIYTNQYGNYYIRIARGYMFPLKNNGFTTEALREKEDISRRTKQLLN